MLDLAYQAGAEAALEDFEKQALLGAAARGLFGMGKSVGKGAWSGAKNFPKSNTFKALKWGAGMGGRGSEWIGAPIGSGLLGAVTAEEGQGMRGFLGGAAMGLGGTVGFKGGQRMMKGLTKRYGSRVAETGFGKSMLQGANAFGAKGGTMHNALGSKFKSIAGSNNSVGNMALTKWAPGALGMGAGLAGSMALAGPSEAAGGLASDFMGVRARPANFFSPVG